MKHLFRIWKGYVKVLLTGYAPERFFNLCNKNEIPLYEIKIEGNGYVFEVSAKDFFRLKKLLRKTGSKVQIIEKKGMPFFCFKYRRRKAFAIALVTACIMLYVMAQFVWKIEVTGNLKITDDQLLTYLNEQHIHTGILLKNVDCTAIEEQIRRDYPDVIWVSVQTEGTILKIQLKEQIKDKTDANTTSSFVNEQPTSTDIIAGNSGTVMSIVTRCGTPLVKEGDTVEKGDVLVSGCNALYDDYGTVLSYSYCDADADVLLQWTDAYNDSIDLNHIESTFTGKERIIRKIILNDKIFTVGFAKNTYETYTICSSQKSIKIGDFYSLPLELITINISETMEKKVSYTESEIEQIVQNHFSLYSKKMTKKGFQIVDKNVKIKFNDEQVLVTGEIVLEGIETARQKPPIQHLKVEEGIE